jgi:hypothetical protein
MLTGFNGVADYAISQRDRSTQREKRMLVSIMTKQKRGPVYTRDPETTREITEWRGACEILNARLTAEGKHPLVDHTVVANLAQQGKIPVPCLIGHTRFYEVAHLQTMDLTLLHEYKTREPFPQEMKEQARLLALQGKQPAEIARILSREFGRGERDISRQRVRAWIGKDRSA